MKRSCSVALAIGAFCFVFQTAHASLLFSEAFNYTAGGTLAPNVNPGSSVAWGAGNSAMTIDGGNLTYPGLTDLGGNDLSVVWGGGSAGTAINTFANVSSGTIYYSFLLDVTTAPTSQSYLTSLNPGTVAPNGSSDAVAMYFGTVTGGGAFRFGLRGGGASATYTSSGSPYSLDTTYLVVLGYDFGAANNNMSLWINPTPGGSMPAANLVLTPTTLATGIANVGFKVQSSPQGAFLIDNLLVGTTWGDVTPMGIPEPSTFALAGLGILSLISARRRMRR